MKYRFTSLITVLLVPVCLTFSDGESMLPNLIGLVYIGALWLASRTKFGKYVIRKSDSELKNLENKGLD